MTKDKFKVGDIIVKVTTVHDTSFPTGKRAEITKCDGDGLPWARIDGEDYKMYSDTAVELDCIDERDWEIEDIVNTPLYEALS